MSQQMRDPNFQGFIRELHTVVGLHRVPSVADSFKEKYRLEIVVLLDMLNRLGLCALPTSIHPDAPQQCDLCGESLLEYRWFADCEHGPHGEWGNLCQSCFLEHGGSIGWGHGQLYLQTQDKRWRLIAGSDPSEVEPQENPD